MATAPNPKIEMIASSLRNCSLHGGGRRRGRGRGAEGSNDSEGVTVELNSDVALPYHWQQCLDIWTGQVYYINWEDGTRTTTDPRTSPLFSTLSTPQSTSFTSHSTAFTSSSSSGCTSASSISLVAAADLWPSNITDGFGYSLGNDGSHGYSEGHSDQEESSSSSSAGSSWSSAVSSVLSSFSPIDESASIGSGNDNGKAASHILITVGCRACFMYFMVPKSVALCPKCGSSGLLQLGCSNNAA